MQPAKVGIILRVKNLAKCRAFYRDILDLGTPVIDSNFRSVFMVGHDVDLCLEAVPGDEKLPQAESRLALFTVFDDTNTVVEKLEAHGFIAKKCPDETSYPRKLEFHDPEGNPFQIQYY